MATSPSVTSPVRSRVSAAGAPLWGKTHGGSQASSIDVAAIALEPGGNVLVAGAYQGFVDLGTGFLPDSMSSEGLFIAKIAP